ncbi:MAG: pantetheine-phosphate adenylyltransferase [Thermoanaerobaculia bacterium]|nr:pantetheine-phosphate adenylyltransferase [Thermoanaerobaculia bacterium]
MTKAVYPGSFDPITNGHVDIIERGARIFDRVTIGVLMNEEKNPLFTADERMELIRKAVGHVANVEVQKFSGLLVKFMEEVEAEIVVRGIRAVSDYEYELQMALMNRGLSPNVETLFMLPSVEYTYVSSRLIKEVYRLGGDVSDLVPANVLERLQAKLR